MTPQITLESPLGVWLKNLAMRSQNIVEIGTGSGNGSTQCLIAGLQPGAHIFTVEGSKTAYDEAVQVLYSYPDVTLLFGVASKTEPPWQDHPHPKAPGWHKEDCRIVRESPQVLDQIPLSIDLLVLDGGEFSTFCDFFALNMRSKIIAMDDTNPARSVKNVEPLKTLKSAGWKMIAEDPNYRNGYAIYERP